MLNGCLNTECLNDWGSCSDQGFCGLCGEELLPFPVCACGEGVNVKWVLYQLRHGRKTFCGGCGVELTGTLVGEFMAKALKADLSRILSAQREVFRGQN